MRSDDLMRSLDLNGGEAFRVGGSVRDELRGHTPKDADYVVTGIDLDRLADAFTFLGGQVSSLRLRTGTQIGWRVTTRDGDTIEVALPRTETSTGPHREDFAVRVDPNIPLEHDCLRRDFTVNALYRRLSDGALLDPTRHGREDVRTRTLRTTHVTSFKDDPLRMLRGLRLVARGFTAAATTVAQMNAYANAVTGLTRKGVSGTALDEFCKILDSKHPQDALTLGAKTGILGTLLPEFAGAIGFRQESRYHDLTVDEHTFLAIQHAADMDCSLRIRMGLFWHDAGKPASAWRGADGRLHYYRPPQDLWRTLAAFTALPEDHEVAGARKAHQALTRLNAPKAFKRDVVTLVERHMVPTDGKVRPVKVRRWRCEIGDELLADLFRMRLCDVMAKGIIDYAQLEAIDKLEHIRQAAERDRVPASVKDLPVTGNVLIALGAEGATIGRVQRTLLHEAISTPSRAHDREWMTSRARKLIARESTHA